MTMRKEEKTIFAIVSLVLLIAALASFSVIYAADKPNTLHFVSEEVSIDTYGSTTNRLLPDITGKWYEVTGEGGLRVAHLNMDSTELTVYGNGGEKIGTYIAELRWTDADIQNGRFVINYDGETYELWIPDDCPEDVLCTFCKSTFGDGYDLVMWYPVAEEG